MSQDKELKELLELANQTRHINVETAEKKYKRIIQRFIEENEIQPGNDKVPAVIIYERYIRWLNGSQGALSKIEFFRQFGSIFTPYNSSGVRGYKLNASGFDLSRESYLRAVQKRQNREKKKKS